MDESGTIREYIPLGWDDINNISWGSECYILIDTLHQLYAVDPTLVDVIFETTKGTEAQTKFSGIVDYIVNNCEDAEQFNRIKAAIIIKIPI